MIKRKSILAIGVIVISFMLIVILALNGSVSARHQSDATLVQKTQSSVSQSQVNPVGSPSNYDAGGKFQYLSGPRAGEPLDIALDFLHENTQMLGVTAADAADLVVTDQYISQHTGVTHIYFQQQYQGIRVYNGLVNVNVAADGSVVNVGNRLVPNVAKSINTTSPSISAVDAVQSAAQELELALTRSLDVEQMSGGPSEAVVLSDGGISQNPIPVSLIYYALSEGVVRLTWDVEIYELSSLHWWSVRVDAVSGEMISQTDYVDNDNWHNQTDEAVLNPDEYNVFAIPKESPYDGARTVEVDPADAIASQFGWHDTDGAAGAEFTTTQGNNAHAYSDTDADNVPDPGSSPDGGAGLVFSHTLDLNMQPSTYVSAAVTNLFYWNNVMHDVMHLYGFDEAAGNFQEMNYSGMGLGNDYVNAEAQDGSGTNNANFGTPPDGLNPRMQMFIWTNPLGQLVTVNTPVTITGSYSANPSNNGGTGNGLTADIEIVDDGVVPTDDACETVNNDLTGKIALLVWSQGICNSSVFVANAAAAGAVAAIIVDITPVPLTNFGGDAAIPSVAVGSTDGQLFIDTINDGGTINATLEDNPAGQINRDSDLDNGVIAHEYGHGISNRLTGGPSQAGCLGNAEQMGEGWSDLMTLILHAAAADTATTNRGVGTYVQFSTPDGTGIRLFPYNTDLNVNPETYNSIITNGTSPHSLGEVWAAMYWEVYWNLVDKHGFNADIYADWTAGGNNLALQLLLDGMKLQPCFPGMVDGRDAILAADQVLTGGDNQCEIWQGFAKRGLGYNADQGDSFSRTDGSEAFNLPGFCDFISAAPLSQEICVGEIADYIVDLGPSFTSPPVNLSGSSDPAGPVISFNPTSVITVPMTSTMSVSTTLATPGGAYTITITGTDTISSATYNVGLTVVAGNPAVPTLTAPPDEATGQIFQPNFTWTAVPNVTEYTIEVATDPAFTNIIESATVSNPSYDLVSVLEDGTVYYWRVQAANVCGTTDSDIYSFTTVSASCTVGTANSIYSEDFDSGAPGWTHSAPIPPDTWVLTDTNSSPGSGSFAYYSQDINGPNEQHLVSPPIVLPDGNVQYQLQFLNEQNFEDPTGSGGCWDGGLLEITTNAGTSWTQLDGELLSDPYNGFGNNGPPNGLNLWCGQVGGEQPWLNSIVNLDAYAGETVQFRFRNLADAGVGAEGWYIDDFQVSSCSASGAEIAVDPTSLTASLAANNVTTQTLTISNVGDGDLDWTIFEDASTQVTAGSPTATVANRAVERSGVAQPGEQSESLSNPVTGGIVADGSFEAGTPNPSWNESSTNFGTPLCDGSCLGPPAHTGSWYVWFGGTSAAEIGSVDQDVTIPAGTAELSFWLLMGVNPGASGFMEVSLDNTIVFSVTEADVGGFGAYAQVTVDVSAFADGNTYNLEFYAEKPDGPNINFFVDDVAIGAGSAVACDAPDDIPWLSVSPTAGTTVSGTSSLVDVTFDSTGLATGVYTGTLCVQSNDIITPLVTVPLTLSVEDPAYDVSIAPDAAITGTAGTTVTYTLHLTNTGNAADTFDLAVGGNTWTTTLSDSTVSLGVGASATLLVTVDIPAGAADGEMDTATVTATSQGDGAVSGSATLMTTAVAAGPSTLYLPVVIKD